MRDVCLNIRLAYDTRPVQWTLRKFRRRGMTEFLREEKRDTDREWVGRKRARHERGGEETKGRYMAVGEKCR